MASSRDAQDILDLKQADTTSRPPKKKSQKPKLVRPAHIPKEVWLLETQGDRAPPVALTAVAPKKPKFTRRVKPWEWQPFMHPNRSDGLVLHHWRKKVLAAETRQNGPATPAGDMTTEVVESKGVQTEPQVDGHWAKYNVKVDVPQYTAEQYEQHLQSEDWSREETDYLIQQVEDFDLRWIVIADRYDYRPALPAGEDGNDTMAVVPAAKPRTMEDLKARYYHVASTMMAIHQPLSSMTQAEFSLHEKMTKFDPAKEAKRKRMAEQLLLRTDEEIEEEKRLLAELKRIVQDEDDFLQERTELYERLKTPQSRGSISMYESSAGLVSLMQNLLAQDKSRGQKQSAREQQKRAIAGTDNNKDKPGSPAQTPGLQGNRDPRKSLDAQTDQRRDSKAGQSAFVQRQLSARDEQRYGVQRPEKLLQGEKIRHIRIERRVTARASSVAAKVQDSMVELGIPIKPVMSTTRITEGYEQLCSTLDLLLDTKRIAEKVENEVKVLAAQKEARKAKMGAGNGAGTAVTQGPIDTGDAPGEGPKNASEGEADAEDAEGDEGRPSRPDSDGGEENGDGTDDGDEDEDENEDDEEDEDEDGDEQTPAANEVADEAEEEPVEEVESRPSTRASGRSGRKRSVSVLSSAPSQKSTKRLRR